MVFIMARREFEVLGITLLYHLPILQNLITWGLNLILLIMFLAWRPHHKRKSNFIDILIEIGFFIVHSLILILAFGDIDKMPLSNDDREILGAVMTIVCTIIFLVEMFLIFYEQYKTYKELIQKCRKRRKEAKEKKKLEEAEKEK